MPESELWMPIGEWTLPRTRENKALTVSEQKTKLVGDGKPEQSQTRDRTRGLSATQTLSGRSSGVCLRRGFVHPWCTNIGLPLGSERGLSDDEDRQHFDCATWLHKAPRDAEGSGPFELKELDGCRMARSRSESSIPCN